jgi:hypothetical protein
MFAKGVIDNTFLALRTMFIESTKAKITHICLPFGSADFQFANIILQAGIFICP